MFYFDLPNPQSQRIGKYIVQGFIMFALTDLLKENSLIEAYVILCYSYAQVFHMIGLGERKQMS